MAEAAKKTVAAKAPKTPKRAPAQAAAPGATITVTQIRSGAGQSERQRSTLTGLGFKKNQQTREIADTPENRGMIRRVQHLLEIVGK